jgi:putative phosphotransacetylase
MGKYDAFLGLLMDVVKNSEASKQNDGTVPVGISNRHVHLSEADLTALFGEGYQLTKIKDLSQPGQYACKETLTVCGPKGAIEKVRILGPVRNRSQVEILKGDCFKLGITAPAKLSGDLCGTPGITLVGSKGSIFIAEGLIVAQRHIHMTSEDAISFGVINGQAVSIQIDGPRGGIYKNIIIRANNASSLECHIDMEEANAMDLVPTSKVTIIR